MIKCPNNLDDTVEYMTSADYNQRLLGEYFQLVIRLKKLQTMLNKWDKHQLDFKPNCPYAILAAQAEHMQEYCNLLEARLKIEGITN